MAAVIEGRRVSQGKEACHEGKCQEAEDGSRHVAQVDGFMEHADFGTARLCVIDVEVGTLTRADRV